MTTQNRSTRRSSTVEQSSPNRPGSGPQIAWPVTHSPRQRTAVPVGTATPATPPHTDWPDWLSILRFPLNRLARCDTPTPPWKYNGNTTYPRTMGTAAHPSSTDDRTVRFGSTGGPRQKTLKPSQHPRSVRQGAQKSPRFTASVEVVCRSSINPSTLEYQTNQRRSDKPTGIRSRLHRTRPFESE